MLFGIIIYCRVSYVKYFILHSQKKCCKTIDLSHSLLYNTPVIALLLFLYIMADAWYKIKKRMVLKMKIAKKVLALVMALAMVAGFACVSFAAQNPTITAKATETDGYVKVVLTAKDAVGMASFDIVLDYDASVLTFDFAEEGVDAAKMSDTKKNSFSYEIGDTDAANGKLLVGGYFKTNIKTAEETAADAKPGKDVTVDDKTFDLVTVYFAVADAEAYNADVKVSGGFGMGENKDDATAHTIKAFTKTVTLKEAPETTTKAPVVDKETTTKKAPVTNPDTGDKPQGDNMALAAAFGVVALAGAAFVITKKRK